MKFSNSIDLLRNLDYARGLFTFFVFGIILLIQNGCNRVPQEDLSPLSTPSSLEDSVQLASNSPLFEEGGWPTARWWEMFGDPQLNGLIEKGLKESPTLQRALAKAKKADQEAKKERAALLPHLDASYTENWEYFSKNGFTRSFFPTAPGMPIPATVNQIDLTLNFQYEIDFFGRHRKRFHQAVDLARAEQMEKELAQLILTTLITQTYIELQTKMAQSLLLKAHLQKLEELLFLTSKRHSHGLDPIVPVLARKQALDTTEQSLIEIEKEIAIDQHALSILVGSGPETPLLAEPLVAFFSHPFPIPHSLSSNLLSRRPDIAAQCWRVEAAAQAIGAAKADFYPRVNLVAFAGLESLSFNKLFSMSSKQGGVDPAIYLPIFTGGKLTANLKAQVAGFNEAVYLYNELLLKAAQEVSDQIITLLSVDRLRSAERKALESAEKQKEIEALRYKMAVSNCFPFIEKEISSLVEQYRLIGYERDYLLAVVKLVKALGGGFYTPPIPGETS